MNSFAVWVVINDPDRRSQVQLVEDTQFILPTVTITIPNTPEDTSCFRIETSGSWTRHDGEQVIWGKTEKR